MEQVFDNSNEYALFLDFDGTLVNFAPTPDGIDVPKSLIVLLEDLNQVLGGALALVTGRSVKSLQKHLAALPLNLAGEHGAHFHYSDGETHQAKGADFSKELAAARKAFASLEGLEVEEKAGGFAIHYRRAPHHTAAIKSHVGNIRDSRDDIEVLHGNMVCELRSKGVHKGLAIERFLTNEPFRGRIPIFIGDDTTDEDGFRAVNRAGGVSIKVGEGATIANERLADVEAVRSWAFEYLRALKGEEQKL